jgi:hypothetical protein
VPLFYCTYFPPLCIYFNRSLSCRQAVRTTAARQGGNSRQSHYPREKHPCNAAAAMHQNSPATAGCPTTPQRPNILATLSQPRSYPLQQSGSRTRSPTAQQPNISATMLQPGSYATQQTGNSRQPRYPIAKYNAAGSPTSQQPNIPTTLLDQAPMYLSYPTTAGSPGTQ